MSFKNTDKFREAALHFQEFKCYTKEPIGSKAWFNFWQQERERCKYGFHTGDDYITGYNYNYLNYSPILQTTIVRESEDEFGQNQADRIKDFPKFYDGDYEFFHYIEEAEKSGQHALMLGSRGKGKSLKAASMCVRNYHHFQESKSYCFAAAEEYLTNDGIITKSWDVMDFIDQNTPWGKRRQYENSALHRKASVKETNSAGIESERGYKSEIIGVTVGDNIDKLRGKRGKLIILEEFGNFPRGKKGWNILRPSMEDGKNTFGLILGIGTGGTEGSNFEAMEELFYNPKAYRIYPVPNIWDEGLENTSSALFYPGWKNYQGAMDEDGNSNKEKALRLIEEDRKLVAQTNDPHTLTRRKAEIPITPREAMMKISGTQFPVAELKSMEAEIKTKPHIYKDADFVGKFELDKDGQNFKFKIDLTETPLYQYPLKDNKNVPGAWVFYEFPKEENGKVIANRYVAGIDSYDFDESTTTSLGSCLIGDLWTKRIIAEYTGRPKTAQEFYENVRRGLLFCNARANIENLNKGIFDYLDNKNCGYLIMDEPRIVKETLESTSMRINPNRRRGTPPSKGINAYARGLACKWLLESTKNADKPEELRIHKLRCLPLIQEMIYWNPDGNFDRVSALQCLMLAFAEYEKYMFEAETKVSYDDIDPFFKRNYFRQQEQNFKPTWKN